jgi:DNA polymerase I
MTDDRMTEDQGPRIDPHTQAAAEMFGVAEDQVTRDMRREAKALNYGAAYALPAPKGKRNV